MLRFIRGAASAVIVGTLVSTFAFPQTAAARNHQGMITHAATGKPLSGVEVRIRRRSVPNLSSSRHVILRETVHRTDAKGRFSFDVATNEAKQPQLFLEVEVRHPGLLLSGLWGPRNVGFNYLDVLKVLRAGKPTFLQQLQMVDAPQKIAGIIRKPDGSPANAISVAVSYVPVGAERFKTHAKWAISLSDKQGRYQFNLPQKIAGVIWLFPSHHAISAYPLHHIENKSRDLTLDPGVRIKGVIQNELGKPAQALWLNATRRQLPNNPKPTTVDLFVQDYLGFGDWRSRSVRPDKHGHFEFDPLPTGDYTIRPRIRCGFEGWMNFQHSIVFHNVPGVFTDEIVKIRPGKKIKPLAIEGRPFVFVELQYESSDGKPFTPKRRDIVSLLGRLDGKTYAAQTARHSGRGRMTFKAPHGLVAAQLNTMLSRDGSYCVCTTQQPDNRKAYAILGTLNDHVKVRIVHYKSPVLSIQATNEAGKVLKDFECGVKYATDGGPFGRPGVGAKQVLASGFESHIIFAPIKSGWVKSKYFLFPGEEFTLVVQAPGHKDYRRKMTLKEGQAKKLKVVLTKE